MACAKCDFYMPKESTAALLLEGKTHLLRLLQEIPLGDAKQAAIEEGVAAYENLLSKLADLPTPAGPTPRQIGAELVQVTSVRRTCVHVFFPGMLSTSVWGACGPRKGQKSTHEPLNSTDLTFSPFYADLW